MFTFDHGPCTLPSAAQHTCPWPSCISMVSDEHPSLQHDLFSGCDLLHIPPACPNILIRWPSSLAELRPSPDVTGVPKNPESHDAVSRRQSRAYNGQAAKQPWLMEGFSETLTKTLSQKRETAAWIVKIWYLRPA
jgi:hypothetical protein